MNDATWPQISAGRPAAVLLLIYPDPVTGEDTVVFTRRTETLSTHRGQISLPGGARDPGDSSPEFTALREAQEEIGIDPAAVQLIGVLPPVPTVVSDFLIVTVIGRAVQRPDFRPNPAEVAELIEVPLRMLRDETIHFIEERETPAGPLIMHSYRVGRYNIWGATGRILYVFLTNS